jgi:hypothetical protein
MFPLSTVVFPGQPLMLNVFEDRYKALLHDVGERGRFGICLIERGSEVGGGDERTNVGTVVVILHVHPMPDGTFMVAVQGEQRLRVAEWLDDAPYPRARVTLLDDSDVPNPQILATAISSVRAVRHLESEVDVDYVANSVCDFDEDPLLASWQCCSYPRMATIDGQHVLAKDSVDERLAMVAEICCERYGDLQRMLQQGL